MKSIHTGAIIGEITKMKLAILQHTFFNETNQQKRASHVGHIEEGQIFESNPMFPRSMFSNKEWIASGHPFDLEINIEGADETIILKGASLCWNQRGNWEFKDLDFSSPSFILE